jgi:hypothetical protein
VRTIGGQQMSFAGAHRPSVSGRHKSDSAPRAAELALTRLLLVLAGSAESPLAGRASASELPDNPLEAAARFSDQRSHRILSGLSV